jgi:uncharacterized protein (TIGR03000 family)
MNSRIQLNLAIVLLGTACHFGQLAVAQAQSDRTYLYVEVPQDAAVYINGAGTKSEGTHRRYSSKNLLPGRRYRYEILVVVERNGRWLERRAEVELGRGESRSVSLLGSFAEKQASHIMLKPQTAQAAAVNGSRAAPPPSINRPASSKTSSTRQRQMAYLPLPAISSGRTIVGK